MAVFTMPILSSKPPETFVWEPTELQRRRAQLNHGQGLERLAERGGLDWWELLLVLLDLPLSTPIMSEANAKARCLELVPQGA